MHDANGTPLQVGDTVFIPAVITQLYDTDEYCNVDLETVHGRRPDDQPENISAINTGHLILVERGNTIDLDELDELDLTQPLPEVETQPETSGESSPITE